MAEMMEKPSDQLPNRLLLHACCGPCSTAPLRRLQGHGVNVTVHFSNANIAPTEEYDLRCKTAHAYADAVGVAFVEDAYEPREWTRTMSTLPLKDRTSGDGMTPPPERCRACYRMRFRRSAAYAREHGYDALGTTLSVSPYQYTDIIREELERACAEVGVQAFFEDYSPLYPETVEMSKEAGLYRQDYCGCLPSKAEADAGREARKDARERKKAAKAAMREKQDADAAKRKEARAAYDAKRAHQRAIKDALRKGNGGSAHERGQAGSV